MQYKYTSATKRVFDWGTIELTDKHTIRIETQTYCVIFHQWFAEENTFRNWTRFRSRVFGDRNLDIYKIYKIANFYDISRTIGRKRSE